MSVVCLKSVGVFINSIGNCLARDTNCSLYVDDFLICFWGKNMATIDKWIVNSVHSLQVSTSGDIRRYFKIPFMDIQN